MHWSTLRRWIQPILLAICAFSSFTFSLSVSPSSNCNTATSTTSSVWKFRNFDIYTEVSKADEVNSNINVNTPKPVVMLIHGFGCSTTYWRETIQCLTQQGHDVHALDLLGQGRSAKPGREDGIEYSINLWARLVDDYAQHFLPTENNIVLMGNSLGSLVALAAACGDFVTTEESSTRPTDSAPTEESSWFLKDKVKGIGMYNCGIGLNSRNIAKEPQWTPTQQFLLNRVFDVINFCIFGNIPLLTFVLKNIVTRDVLRDALISLYACADDPASRVDEALVDSFFLPAQDDGAVEALSQIYCNDPGATPMELHETYASVLQSIPIHLVWGDADVVTPIQGGLGTYYSALAASNDDDRDGTTGEGTVRNNISMDVVHGGHILFDEVPQVANGAMLKWLKSL